MEVPLLRRLQNDACVTRATWATTTHTQYMYYTSTGRVKRVDINFMPYLGAYTGDGGGRYFGCRSMGVITGFYGTIMVLYETP